MSYRYLIIGIDIEKFASAIYTLDEEGWDLVSTNIHKIESNIISNHPQKKELLMLVLRIDKFAPPTNFEISMGKITEPRGNR